MSHRSSLIAGILFALLAVALGAFGAHALKSTLVAHGRQETYELAVRYQFFHAFALMACGVLMKLNYGNGLRAAAVCFVAGITIFSGSLYVLSLTGITVLGAITPIGGVGFLTGWILMLVSVYKSN